MAGSLALVLGQIDPVAGGIIGAVLTAAGVVGASWAGKTRPAAAVERSQAALTDAERWDKLISRSERLLADSEQANAALRTDIGTLRDRVEAAEEALGEERRECDRRISELEERLQGLVDERPPARVWFRE